MNELTEIPLEYIRIGKRFRKEPATDIGSLVSSIRSTGLLHPIVLNGNTLVAGARRIEAYRILGMPKIPAVVVNVKDILHAEVEENVARKDFTLSELVAIDREFGPKLAKEAEKRKVEVGKATGRGHKGGAKLAQPFFGKTRDAIANYAGVSHGTLDKAKYLVSAAEKYPKKFGELVTQVDTNPRKLDSAYKQVKREVHKMEVIKAGKDLKTNGQTRLFVGDFRRVCPDNLATESIDAIITDPPYGEEYLHLFSDLVNVTGRVLKKNGSMFIMSGQSYLPEVYRRVLENRDLNYHWTIAMLLALNNSNSIFPKKVFVAWKPVIWLVKGEFNGDWHHDIIVSDRPTKDLHDWQQNPEAFSQLLQFYTKEGDMILDPMMGSGSVGEAALNLKRRFIGIDIKEESVAVARGRFAGRQERENELAR